MWNQRKHGDPVDCPAGGLSGQKEQWGAGGKTLWLGMRDIAVFVQGSRYAREFGPAG